MRHEIEILIIIYRIKMNFSRLELYEELILADPQIFRKENTNLALKSCISFALSRFLCKNCVCENCKLKISDVSKVFITKIQGKLSQNCYNRNRLLISCKD